MLVWRKMLVLVAIAGALALLAPAAALASGPSAGDQQYIDPLGGSHSSGGSHHSSGGSHSSGTPSSNPTAPSATPTTPSSGATVSSSSTTTTASVTPPATTASATSAKDPPKSLPRTGFDVWLAVLIGAGLLSSGLIVRRSVRGER